MPRMDGLAGYSFGATLFYYITRGYDWPQTLLFPRVAYCRVPSIQLVGVTNTYTAQCTLPLNMLNEKIYIFLWFWFVLVIAVTVVNSVVWLGRILLAGRRQAIVKRLLRVYDLRHDGKTLVTDGGSDDLPLRLSAEVDVNAFCSDYLKRDGVFVLFILAGQAGDLVAAEVAGRLGQEFLKSRRRRDLTPTEDGKELRPDSQNSLLPKRVSEV